MSNAKVTKAINTCNTISTALKGLNYTLHEASNVEYNTDGEYTKQPWIAVIDLAETMLLKQAMIDMEEEIRKTAIQRTNTIISLNKKRPKLIKELTS